MADNTRRPHGTGSVYYDKTRRRWVATYEAGWTTRGTRRRRKVSAPTEKAARAKLLKAIRETQPDATTSARPTVKRWAEQWLEITGRQVRPSTWATNRSQVNRWIVPTIGHKRLDLLTPGDIRTVTRAVLDAGRLPSTAHRVQAVAEKMLKDALREGHAVPERVFLVDGPTAGESDRDAIPLPDALALIEAATGEADESRWVAAFLQGMRQAECLGLTWDRIDFERSTIDVSWQMKPLPYVAARDRASGFRVPDGYEARQVRGALHLVRPKTAHGKRVIPMVPWMSTALQKWRDRCPDAPLGLVWPDEDGQPRTARADRASWSALQDRAQVARVDGTRGRRYVIHEARHTTAVLLRWGGAPDEIITAILGHASILSTRAYLHTDDVGLRRAMESMAHRLGLGPARLDS